MRHNFVVYKLPSLRQVVIAAKWTKTGVGGGKGGGHGSVRAGIVKNSWALGPGVSELNSWLCNFLVIKHG